MRHLLGFKSFSINESKNIISVDKQSIQKKLVDFMGPSEIKRGNKIKLLNDYIDVSSSKIKIEVDHLTQGTLDNINGFMDQNGWFPTDVKAPGELKGKYSGNIKSCIDRKKVQIGYEAKTGEQFNIPPDKTKAYHVTPDILLDKIRGEGLVPKTESKLADHPERIYLFLNSEDTPKQMVGAIWNSLTDDKKRAIKDYYLLEVDLKKLPDHKFYLDPQSSLTYISIFTTNPIPKSAIKIIDKITTSGIKSNPSAEDEKRWEEDGKRFNKESRRAQKDKKRIDTKLDKISSQIGDNDYISMEDLMNPNK
jgi:hypothetical protein